ncbi:coiled-coil and C2 domain-containing protein 1B isoform X1 [Varanus komodoensis]|uniref:coiled-coil and C2 domain-containing protein 1B isoform X1 n=1 Tax=Varanus komodoensis TaxID=61221 RepID=UPI001CF7A8BB|nr:coiled-coil and C2 domain-containing protein 1B isoform X1 [Varanus komodoensis]XP_044285854.1 coiled-coil and C2 domain-containing protein 1B isoform X1 [Varanus komodoensis]XP_044285855.1 coiled-coil and C2 domain-containing protein 1B isoform X1 [Varanus komodoensis]
MLGRRPRKSPQVKGQAAAKQLGLFVEFNPEEMLLELEDNGDLEAELAAITGESLPTGKNKPKGKAPLPMDQIEKMASECMKDLNEEDDEGLEEDTELLAELQEVLGEEDGGGDSEHETETREASPVAPVTHTDQQTQMTPAISSGLQQTIEERIANYKSATANAKEAGESAKVRRYERGLKTLEAMLSAVKKGKKVNEEEMPPPVASGKSSLTMPKAVLPDDLPEKLDVPDEIMVPEEEEEKGGSPVDHELKDPCDVGIVVSPAALQGQDADTDALAIGTTSENISPSTRALLVTREKEYKLAALKAKHKGNLEKAKEFMRTGKKFSMLLEALDSGRPIDLRNMPPAPQELESPEKMQLPSKPTPVILVETSQPITSSNAQGSLQQPKTVLEALQQRLEKYTTAAAQAKASGDGRKSRMHERIAKQYQDAIRAHKAGRKVNFAELPVPPGFPPIPGMAPADEDDTVAAVLENVNRLVKMEEEEEEHEGDEEDVSSVQAPAVTKPTQLPKKPVQVVNPLTVPSAVMQEETVLEKENSLSTSITAPEKSATLEQLSQVAREQVEFLENRKKQYLKAAIQAKKKNDIEQAKMYLRTAKSFDPKIELAKSGKSIDISKLPSPPTDDEGDFIFIHHEDVRLSQKAEEVYAQLIKLLKDQHEKCVQYSKQFMHLGNVTETSRFEKLAQNCKKDLDILQLAQAQGLDPPSHHFEERTFKIVRIFSELSSTEMHLIVVRGINLPAPPGVAPNDLDAFVKFEFHYPNTEQAQKSKTSVIKNNNCPVYDQLFKLNINRNHRGFRRAIQAKGIKFEIFHKGSFFRSDKQVGTAHLKLDKLESECEIREIIEVLDGRKPTGGKLEVKVRLREPLSGQDLQTITENWLVLEH